MGVLLLVAAVLAIAGGYAWFDTRKTQQAFHADLVRRLADSDAALAQAKARDVELAGDLREMQAKAALFETRLAEVQSQEASLESLYRDLSPVRDELALNEAEQLLLLASRELALAGNVRAALSATQLADAKLAGVERPQLVPLRRAIARDLEQLKAVPYVDVAGIALKLDQVMAAIDSLPLAQDERLPPPAPPLAKDVPRWRVFLHDAWADVKALIRIEVSDRPAAPLVAPSQQYFLRENLRLRLLSARIALLSRDEATFRVDVSTALEWVRQFFDTRKQQVQAVDATLSQLVATPMPTTLPDVSGSLAAMRLAKDVRDRRAEPPAARAAAPAR
jgi:uroporphyrin-3 C-methyltransferase